MFIEVYGTVLVGGIGNGCISALVVVTAQSTLKDERDTGMFVLLHATSYQCCTHHPSH